MKALYVLISLFLLSACVSSKKYHILQNEWKSMEATRKKVTKEIRWMEHANKKLEDSITKNIELAQKLSYKIEKRLALNKIKVKLNSDELKLLQIRNQDMDDEEFISLKNKYNFNDTLTAKKTEWLSLKERELVYWLNYARLNPKMFCMKYIYPKYTRDSNNVYIATLMDYMLTMKPVPALFPDKKLYESAKCHAVSMGKEGLTGHKRIEGCHSSFSGECCSYGLSDPREIVIQLLIDEDVTSLGHRYICLGTYSKIGISIKPHKYWGTNAVLDFGYGSI
jgi:uncharacterized protein YkwD